jgi:hypothetical protein
MLATIYEVKITFWKKLVEGDPMTYFQISKIRVQNPGQKTGSKIRVQNPDLNPGPKSGSEIRVRNPGPKSGSEIRVQNPGPKSESKIRVTRFYTFSSWFEPPRHLAPGQGNRASSDPGEAPEGCTISGRWQVVHLESSSRTRKTGALRRWFCRFCRRAIYPLLVLGEIFIGGILIFLLFAW